MKGVRSGAHSPDAEGVFALGKTLERPRRGWILHANIDILRAEFVNRLRRRHEGG